MKNSKSIELSPKYGLNPVLLKCFWCGKDTGPIALCGRIRKRGDNDMEAPKNMVNGYEPCSKCMESFKKMIDRGYCILLGAKPKENEQLPAVTKNQDGTELILTGKHMGASYKVVSSIFGSMPGAEQFAQENHFLLTEDAVLERMLEKYKEQHGMPEVV